MSSSEYKALNDIDDEVEMQTQTLMDATRLGEGVGFGYDRDEIEKEKQQIKNRYRNQLNQQSNNGKNNYVKVTQKTKEKEDFIQIKPLNKWFKYSLSYKTSLANLGKDSDTTKESANLSLFFSPAKYFFATAFLSKTLNNKHNKYYEPDFSYSFGYANWHQNTFGLVYSNYADNKFNPTGKKDRFNFSEGTWDFSYKNKFKDIYLNADLEFIPKGSKTYLSLKASKKIKKFLFSAKFKHYLHNNQDQVTLSARGFVYKKIYASASVYLYSHMGRQSSNDPDYAFSIGWKDTRKGKMSIMLSNYYTPTRFGWRDQEDIPLENISLTFSMNF